MPRCVGVGSNAYHRLLGDTHDARPRRPVRRLSSGAMSTESLFGLSEWAPHGVNVNAIAPASDYVHGIVLPVDGGWLAR